MAETLTLVARSSRSTGSALARVSDALRSYWTGPFSLKDPALNKLFGVGARTSAGPLVNEATAFTCAAFWDGVQQISADVAKLPLNLKKRRQDGGTDDYTESKLFKLLKYSPNPETRSMVFRRTLTVHALVYGNGYAEIERDALGRPAALWQLHPSQVEPYYEELRQGGKRLRYRISGEEGFLPSDVIHIQGMGDTGAQGWNLVGVAREAIGLALASQQFASSFFGNGTRFGGVLSSDQELDEDQKGQIQEQIKAMHARADKAFGLLVLGAGFKFQQSGVNPDQAQMEEIRNQQVMEVARFLNMPLPKLKINLPGAMSYASIEQLAIDYFQSCLQTWITLWEEELNAKLVPALEVGRQFVKHNTRALLRSDFKTQNEALSVARDRGIINADEWREWLDMNPQEGGQGTAYLVQAAQIPVDLLVEKVNAEIEKIKAETKRAATPPTAPSAPSGPDEETIRKIAEMTVRAEMAEALAREAEQKAIEERDKRVALEASGSATAAEIAARREAESVAIAKAAQFEMLSVDLRGQLETARAALDAAEAKANAEAEEKIAAEQRAAAALAVSEQAKADAELAQEESARAIAKAGEAITAAEVARVEAEARQREADARAVDAESRAVQAREALTAAQEAEAAHQAALESARAEAEQRQAAVEAALADLERETSAHQQDASALDEARQALATAQEALTSALSDRDRLVGEAAEAAAVLEAARQAEAEAQSEVASVRSALDDSTRELASAREALSGAEAERERLAAQAEETARRLEVTTAESERLEAEAAEARAAVEGMAGELTEARQRADLAAAEAEAERVRAQQRADEDATSRRDVETTLRVTREDHAATMTRVIGAHRALLVDALGRLARRETTQARRAQATADKLRRWLQGLDEGHETVGVEMVTPALRVHLAWIGSADEPSEAAAALVAAHVGEFRKRVESVLSGPSEDFHAALERCLAKWETERPEAVADALLREEIDYVRRHS